MALKFSPRHCKEKITMIKLIKLNKLINCLIKLIKVISGCNRTAQFLNKISLGIWQTLHKQINWLHSSCSAVSDAHYNYSDKHTTVYDMNMLQVCKEIMGWWTRPVSSTQRASGYAKKSVLVFVWLWAHSTDYIIITLPADHQPYMYKCIYIWCTMC